MSVRYLAATELLSAHLSGIDRPTASVPLAELAISAVSLEWILADAELDEEISAPERNNWRTNVTNFRKLLIQSGGMVTAVSEDCLEQWGKAILLKLEHQFDGEPEAMSSEERLVVATAKELGLIYLTPARDWNETLRSDFGLAIEEA